MVNRPRRGFLKNFDGSEIKHVSKTYVRELPGIYRVAAALKSVMEDLPGLVLLDVHLPFIDGVAVCRLLRSRGTSAAIPILIDVDAVSVNVSGAPVRWTRREFELLRFLIENRNRVLSRDRLLERVWGLARQVETRSVDVHVGRLGGKLGPAGRQSETGISMGYRFVETPNRPPR